MSGLRVSATEVRAALLARREIALFDVRAEAAYAEGHPLFAAQLPVDRIAVEAAARVPRKGALVVLYDDGEGLAEDAAARFHGLGYGPVAVLDGGLGAWRRAGFEVFGDVNSASKAFGELVEAGAHTPSLGANEVHELLERQANVVLVDARRLEEHGTMSIPTSTSVPGAELVLRVETFTPDPTTTIVVHCAGRTRSIVGAQSLLDARVPNPVVSLRNGTIGWTLAGKDLVTGDQREAPLPSGEALARAQQRARAVAYRAGVRRVDAREAAALARDEGRTLYRFDVRSPAEFAAGHLPGFRSAPGGQLVQETDVLAPVRGARILLADGLGVRAFMTAAWLARMDWDVYVLDEAFGAPLETGEPGALPPRSSVGRYRRPYEGTDHPRAAMEAYLAWEHGLVAQLARDGSHGFRLP